jgi:hypothetical protein
MRHKSRPSSPTGLVIQSVHEKQAYSIDDALQHADFGYFQMALVGVSGLGALSIGSRLAILTKVFTQGHSSALAHIYFSLAVRQIFKFSYMIRD